jgi:hypothetical protein
MEGDIVNVDIDFSDFNSKFAKISPMVLQATDMASIDVANELLRLSTFEVPHDTGMLQTSGHIEPQGLPLPDNEVLVGYNKVYAARLHEHPEYRFQKGRKGKYLEDPLKVNLGVFEKYWQTAIGEIIK